MTATELELLRSLEERVAKAEVERDEYRKLVLLLQEQNEKLKRGLLSQKAERLPKLVVASAEAAAPGEPR